MKSRWDNEDYWLITPVEKALVMAKSHANRFGFAVLLVFFRDRGRFPWIESEETEDGFLGLNPRLIATGQRNSHHIPTAHYDETLSSIAVYGDENGTDWQGQKHPLLIVYHNYVIEKNNLSNLQIGTDSSDDENIIFFEVSSEKINGKSAQDIFYQWTSAFAPEFIQGTEKEKYVFPFDKWRMALIYNDRVISTPYLYTALRDKFAVSTFNSQKIRLLNLKSKN